MSLTKEDLQAISDLMDSKLHEYDVKIQKRFDEQNENINKRFDEQDAKFNKRFDEQDAKFNKRFDEQDAKISGLDAKVDNLIEEFNNIITDNNLLIAEHVQRIVSESEERLVKEINEIKKVTADNCYNIATIKHKIS